MTDIRFLFHCNYCKGLRKALFLLSFLVVISGISKAQSTVKLIARQNEKFTATISDRISFDNSKQINLGDSLHLNGGNPPFTYSWKSGNSVVSSGEDFNISPSIVPSSFEITITDSHNCRIVRSVMILVGIEDEEFLPVKVYPVPASSYITIDPGAEYIDLNASLYTISGTRLWEKIINQKVEIEIDLLPGTYILELRRKSSRSVRKIIVTGR